MQLVIKYAKFLYLYKPEGFGNDKVEELEMDGKGQEDQKIKRYEV